MPEFEQSASEADPAARRVFLDWNAPCLEQAARWLLDAQADPRACDLERTLCILSGKRAGRLLLAQLLLLCEQRNVSLLPPRIATPRVAVDLLTLHARPGADEPPLVVASPVESQLAWLEALRAASPAEREAFIPHPPHHDDVNAWLALADLIDGARSELAGERKSFADAASMTARMDLDRESARWIALASLEKRYRACLREAGLADADDARERCLNGPARTHEFDRIVAIAAPELNELQRSALRCAAAPVTALVHAPGDLADRFDEFGCVIPEAWRDVHVDLDDGRHVLEVADRPADQAQVAMHAIAAREGNREPAEITIGIADESLAGSMHIASNWAGLAVHDAGGVPLSRTAPFQLLETVADWIEDPRFTHFVKLLRIPEIESALEHVDPSRRGRQQWLTLLDDYFNDHLQQRLTGTWLADPDDEHSSRRADILRRVYQAVVDLLEPLAGDARPLHEWADAAVPVLEDVYGRAQLSTQLREQLEAVAGALQQAGREPPESLSITMPAHLALRIVLRFIGDEAIPAAARRGEVDMLGWLELHLDLAPMLVLAGVNDGSLPTSRRGDSLLPDSLRKHLGLPCNERRFARDAYLLSAILHSRDSVTLIAGKRAGDGSPLTPSRLLFACDDDTLVERVRQWCDDAHHVHVAHPLGLPAPATKSLFVVPDLPADLEIPDSLYVTAFRDYLACPYRFALKHLCKLEPHGEAEGELDPLQFGSLAHDVLEAFGTDPTINHSTNEDEIRAFLFDTLRDMANARFGDARPAAVHVQIARLEARLRDFAPVQAQLCADNWRIVHCEHRFKGGVPLDIDGQSDMILRGKIDRIDRHETTGEYRIIDYKTSEGGGSPMKAHYGTEKYHNEWIDLQLPLYDFMVRKGNLLPPDAAIECGYIVLPKQTNGVAYRAATWDAAIISDAIDEARHIVRRIRSREFTMDKEFASPFDPFARITQTTTFAALMRADDEEADS